MAAGRRGIQEQYELAECRWLAGFCSRLLAKRCSAPAEWQEYPGVLGSARAGAAGSGRQRSAEAQRVCTHRMMHRQEEPMAAWIRFAFESLRDGLHGAVRELSKSRADPLPAADRRPAEEHSVGASPQGRG